MSTYRMPSAPKKVSTPALKVDLLFTIMSQGNPVIMLVLQHIELFDKMP